MIKDITSKIQLFRNEDNEHFLRIQFNIGFAQNIYIPEIQAQMISGCTGLEIIKINEK